MSDPLECLWPHMDVPRPMIAQHLVSQWPQNVFHQLLTAGFIREAGSVTCVACPICFGAHKEKVVVAREDDGSCRYFIYCPVVLRAELTADDLRQWTIDFDAVVHAIARAMGLQGRCTALVPEHLWFLGRVAWQGRRRRVLFVRGFRWHDDCGVIDRIHSHHRPIVLATYQEPPQYLMPTPLPPIVPLEEIASLNENEFCLDRILMAAMIDEADAMVEDCRKIKSTDADLRQLVRRQVKAERKAELTDDLLVAAYKQEGSYRKAAAALAEANMKTSLWAVRRAVDRTGGVSAISRKQ